MSNIQLIVIVHSVYRVHNNLSPLFVRCFTGVTDILDVYLYIDVYLYVCHGQGNYAVCLVNITHKTFLFKEQF